MWNKYILLLKYRFIHVFTKQLQHKINWSGLPVLIKVSNFTDAFFGKKTFYYKKVLLNFFTKKVLVNLTFKIVW